jgi:hypothetical protein
VSKTGSNYIYIAKVTYIYKASKSGIDIQCKQKRQTYTMQAKAADIHNASKSGLSGNIACALIS